MPRAMRDSLALAASRESKARCHMVKIQTRLLSEEPREGILSAGYAAALVPETDAPVPEIAICPLWG